uniref:Uncharacterized protein n=1 Tax=Ascaris lumbricoides TaxID=6252 RepID=A0A0M3IV60_ASCLU
MPGMGEPGGLVAVTLRSVTLSTPKIIEDRKAPGYRASSYAKSASDILRALWKPSLDTPRQPTTIAQEDADSWSIAGRLRPAAVQL